ncbi:carbamoyl-phosphate synthase large subunit [Helicobacter macacae]|uniref:Carbamoyl phosphate synthase large chain n=1 Tax=Helicobacter macacae MIT 99-5501 TaxID=1357400 RepID=V8CEM2_9HELI|nr:carbamoyl-phosphate synthase large subunit [Helicobacter macacae]ETD25186.1 carbamoyl-phosphate synthase, large subunit [Helicobacter macacae MIT 99-5501]
MPQRTDIKNILLIGSGPIVIGQACEFDYSGTQAAKTLKNLGYRVVLINSNPATIMTDPDFAHRTYIEPITKEVITNIIAQEKIDAILPTMGGQTALNVAMEMYESGALDGVKFLGANPAAIKKGEDRQAFKEAMLKIGMDLPKSHYAYNEEEAEQAAQNIGFPLIIRASYTLAGGGSGVAYNIEEFKALAKAGLEASPINEILIEESLLGWKEFEMEVIRDKNDNCIIVCSIENLDPMGVHTGDSITIAPALTLTDKEYQRMRDASFKILREIGVDTGGSNVQFAINPKNGRMTVIEMNPRVSRSSALASKATGYPIAKVATMLAVGFSLDEISNDITGTPASFEPSIDYIVTKIPRFAFEKFPLADSTLTTSMKSIGEVMAIGGCFKESLQKALCSLENGLCGFDSITSDIELAKRETRRPNANRILYVADCFRLGLSIDEVADLSHIDKWFLSQIYELVSEEGRVKSEILRDSQAMRNLKSQGFSDKMLARLLAQNEGVEVSEGEIYMARKEMGVVARYEEVDTCAAEFEALTPYLYSTIPCNPLGNSSLGNHCTDLLDFESLQTLKSSSLPKSSKNSTSTTANTRIVDSSIADSRESLSQKDNAQKVLIIGGGPNRIGQGIEFDYCCVHSSFALKDLGVQSIMYNCNPETVSTDYDTSDTLYFEPIDFERVRSVVEREKPSGIIVHFGGQTPLKLAKNLTTIGAKIIGTKASVIDTAEDREKFAAFAQKLNLNQPQNGSAVSKDEAFDIAHKIGYPVLVRPSYVLGGRAMRIVQSDEELRVYMDEAVKVSEDSPVLIDKFLDHATELDVDAICDGEEVYIGGIMQHIEEAGVHSGDSTSVLPSISIDEKMLKLICEKTEQIALELGIIGLLNIQYAIHKDTLYIIEVNPRASRTVPFVSKATGIPLAKVATRVMWNCTINSSLGNHLGNPSTSLHCGAHSSAPHSQGEAITQSITANTRIMDSKNNSTINANSSIVSEKSGLCSHERGNKTKASIDEASGKLHDLSPQGEFAKGILREALKFYDIFNRIDFTTKPLSHKTLNHISVKESIFPFNKLNGADLILGPEMKSTGEVMGISSRFGISFAKAQNASKNTLPKEGKIFISLADCDKEFALSVASKFINLGFSVCATSGTHRILQEAGIAISCVLKISEGRPNIKDLIMNKEIALVINTSDGAQSTNDAKSIRRQVLKSLIPYFTTIAAAEAAAESIKEIQQHDSNIPKALQDFM